MLFHASHRPVLRLSLALAGCSLWCLPLFAHATAISNGMNASWVLGQPDFTSSGGTTTQNGMYSYYRWSPNDVVYDSVHQRLFTTDTHNERILVYDLSNGITNGMNASYVLGPPDFTSTTHPLTATGLITPVGLAYDPSGQRLFVANVDRCGVLVYDLSGGIVNGMKASNVIGEPNLTTSTCTQAGSNTTATGALTPWPIYVEYAADHHWLFVGADDRHLLIYDLSNGITNGMQASYTLGEPDFYTKTDQTTQSGTRGNYPRPTYDSNHQRLFLGDAGNNRILVYDLSNGITNGMNASYVLGQANFTSSGAATTQNGLHSNNYAFYDTATDRLFVSDGNTGSLGLTSRLLVYDLSNGITNGMNASYVLGEPDFTSGGLSTTQSGVRNNGRAAYDATHHHLFVADGWNNRILVYDLSPSSTTITVSASPTTITEGGSVTLTATVSPSSAAGTVTFYDNGSSSLGTAALSSGTATLTYSKLLHGVVHIHAEYAGNNDYTASTSASVDVTVKSASSSDSASGGGGGGGGGGRSSTLNARITDAQGLSGAPALPSSASSSAAATSKPSPQARPPAFHDVPSNAWFAVSVQAIVQAGIASGYADAKGNPLGLFGPADPVTYAQVAKMILLTAKTDVPPASPGQPWFTPYIAETHTLGLSVFTRGLDVNEDAPRGAVIQSLLEALKIPLDPYAHQYADVPASSPYAAAVTTATKLGLVQGDTDAQGKPAGTFRPNDPINRAEVAKIIALAIRLKP